MASTWEAEEKNGGLMLSYGDLSGPISRKAALTFAGRIVSLCGETQTTSSSKVATAAAPAGKGPKKPRKK